MELMKRNIALLLAISSISGIITPTLMNLKEINSYAYNTIYNLNEEEKNELDIKKIVGGYEYTVFLKKDGTVWSTGHNLYGQLGIGNYTNQSTPVQLPISDVRDIMCGNYRTIFIKNDGTLWGCGWNEYGSLGVDKDIATNIPVQIPIDNVKEVICGNYNTFFIKHDGTVWSCGRNNYGQLGVDNKIDQSSPVKINITNVKEVVNLENHTMFIKNDGTVWACGYNIKGELGIGNNTSYSIPIKVDINNVKKVIGCYYYTIFLKNDGTVWSVGSNNYGQLGIGNNTNQNIPVKVNITDVKDIFSTDYTTLFLKEDNSVWGTGMNNYGQLGTGNYTEQNKPVQSKINDVRTIICGSYYTFFIKNDGTAWGTGINNVGQLGVGNTTTQYSPIEILIDKVVDIACGYNNAMFIKSDGTAWATGYNNYGQLGVGNTTYQIIPTKINSSLIGIADLVLKAEKTKLQSDFDIAKDKVDKMSTSTEKTELQNRLNILQMEITNIKTATDLLEILEQNKIKDNISIVQNAINLITDTNIKQQLQDRLDIVKNEVYSNDVNYSKLLESAKDKLNKAQSSKNNIDITFAQLAIDKLNPDDKTILQEQLNNLKETIKIEKEILDYSKLLEDAEFKVTKAESSKKDYDITVAQLSINKLKVEDKPQVQERLDNLVYTLLLEDANLKVVTAEDLRTDSSINIAQIAVDKVPHKELSTFDLLETDLLEKPILQSKLDNLKLSIEEERYLKLLEDANTKVALAEETKTLKDIKLAQLAIDKLKEIDKTELQRRLDALNQLIKDEEKDKNAILMATTKVEQAEKIDNSKYLEEAKELVDSLKPSDEKDSLQNRIYTIETNSTKIDEKIKTLIYQAEVYVKQAEALKRETYIIKAQAGIDKIAIDNPERELLQDRLNSIKVKK